MCNTESVLLTLFNCGAVEQVAMQGVHIWGRHMSIWHDEAAAAAAARPLNPIHTCHSASQLSQQPQGTPARGRSLQALWVNERSIRLSNQTPLE
jgi:hypothetical protein